MAVGRQFGPFTLNRKLARGGMADIFLASRRTDNGEELCVIKMMLPQKLRDPRALKLFLGEARLAAQLDHPNVAKMLLLDRVDDYYFIAMEYVPGATLYHLLIHSAQANKSIPPYGSASMIHQCCLGLEYAHTQTDKQGNPLRLVHRDISPSNLILSFQGRVKILDFGIAAAATRTAGFLQGKAFGKFGYMSPEQCRGKELDHRSDIFSLGVVFWELCTGGALFPGKDPDRIMSNILAGDIPPPTRVNTNVPTEIEQVIMKALAVDPKDRYQSAGDMGLAVEEACGSKLSADTVLAGMMIDLFGEESATRAQAGEVGEEIDLETLLFDDLDAEPPERSEADVSRWRSVELTRSTWILLVVVMVLLVGAVALKLAADSIEERNSHNPERNEPPQRVGTIQVDSTPRGARIILDGEDTGQNTPSNLVEVPIGVDLQVGLLLDGFLPWTGRVRLESEEPRRVNAVLIAVKKDPPKPRKRRRTRKRRPNRKGRR